MCFNFTKSEITDPPKLQTGTPSFKHFPIKNKEKKEKKKEHQASAKGTAKATIIIKIKESRCRRPIQIVR
jgi:hypothetical protein